MRRFGILQFSLIMRSRRAGSDISIIPLDKRLAYLMQQDSFTSRAALDDGNMVITEHRFLYP